MRVGRVVEELDGDVLPIPVVGIGEEERLVDVPYEVVEERQGVGILWLTVGYGIGPKEGVLRRGFVTGE